jgi:dihydroxy-acid dehydratase
VEDGDTITVDLRTNRLDCAQLADPATHARRLAAWQAAAAPTGSHPRSRPVATRLLGRMRATARPALEGGGMAPTP